MTTTIIVETHGWPVSVSTSSSHSHSDERIQSHGYQESTVFVGKGEKQQFHITQGSSITVRELPADAEGLYEVKAETTLVGAAPTCEPVPADA